MKVWLTDAEIEGLMTDKYFHKYPTKAHDVDNIYLTEEEIRRLYDIDFTNEEVKKLIDPKSNIEQTRDLFIIACWTGLRYGDWHDLSKSQITKDRITMTTHKTMKEVTIPLHPMVKKILKKYNGKLPKSVDKTKTIKQIQKCGDILTSLPFCTGFVAARRFLAISQSTCSLLIILQDVPSVPICI